MKHALTSEELLSLEEYAAQRPVFRAQVMEHKKHRQLPIGPNARLYFEDELTIRYQVQEMLRAERIFEAQGIKDELDAYNPLIPDGSNWKATFMIEYEDAEKRQAALSRLVHIEDRVWMQVEGFEQVWAIADEDLERETNDKTSAVHFLRFELTPEMVAAVKGGAEISAGIEQQDYNYQVMPIPEHVRTSLANDLE
jgi:hypothetical protein